MSRIKKVLNSSVILVEDKKNNEYIILGKGIGFGRKKGEIVDENSKNFQYFFPVNPEDLEQVTSIINEIPAHILNVTSKVIEKSKEMLKTKFNNNIYLLLADHINFAIYRYEKNIKIQNRLSWEIKSFYPEEYKAALWALNYINENLVVNLPESEAVNIAFHLINASNDESQKYDSEKYAKTIGDIVKISIEELDYTIKNNDINYIRYTTHIKFLVERIFNGKMLENTNEELYYLLKENNKIEYEIANKIKDYIYSKFDIILSDEEMIFIIVHLNRLYSIN